MLLVSNQQSIISDSWAVFRDQPVAEISKKSLWNNFDRCLENENGREEEVAYFQCIADFLQQIMNTDAVRRSRNYHNTVPLSLNIIHSLKHPEWHILFIAKEVCSFVSRITQKSWTNFRKIFRRISLPYLIIANNRLNVEDFSLCLTRFSFISQNWISASVIFPCLQSLYGSSKLFMKAF